MIIYIVEEHCKLRLESNQIIVENTKSENNSNSFPIEIVNGIILIDRVSISGVLINKLLEKNIVLTWLSHNGRFQGQLENTLNYNIVREQSQFTFFNNYKKRLSTSKVIVYGKIHNQREVLKRYQRNFQSDELGVIINKLKTYLHKVDDCYKIEQLMGYEGYSARLYYKGVGLLVPKEFKFEKRTKQPPMDPYNAIISFGYTLLLYEIFSIIKNKGGNPYIPFMHELRNGHPALCSDLMEEWRPILIDTIGINMLKNGELNMEHFSITEKGVFINKEGLKKFLYKYESKMNSSHKFLGDDKAKSYRKSLEEQVNSIFKIIDGKNDEYKAILVR